MKCHVKNCFDSGAPFCERHFASIPLVFAKVIASAYKTKPKDTWLSFVNDALKIIEEKLNKTKGFREGFLDCKTAQEKRTYWDQNIEKYNYPYAIRRPGPRGAAWKN